MSQTNVKWLVCGFAVALVLGGMVWLATGLFRSGSGGELGGDRSVVLSKRKINNVQNGSAFDRSDFELGDVKKVVIPHDAEVREAKGNRLQLFMGKRLSFMGHVGHLSILDLRKKMGCAVRRDRDALVLGTYGEWDSRIEGGASMTLILEVPKGIGVELRKGLSGQDNPADVWHAPWRKRPADAGDDFWFRPSAPSKDWRAVRWQPDTNRTAK